MPLVAGVSELTTDRAVDFARDAEKIGVERADGAAGDGLRADARTSWTRISAPSPRRPSLPIMLYNNPPAYRVKIELETLEQLATMPNIVAVKESAPDPRRFTDLINRFGDRYTLLRRPRRRRARRR